MHSPYQQRWFFSCRHFWNFWKKNYENIKDQKVVSKKHLLYIKGYNVNKNDLNLPLLPKPQPKRQLEPEPLPSFLLPWPPLWSDEPLPWWPPCATLFGGQACLVIWCWHDRYCCRLQAFWMWKRLAFARHEHPFRCCLWFSSCSNSSSSDLVWSSSWSSSVSVSMLSSSGWKSLSLVLVTAMVFQLQERLLASGGFHSSQGLLSVI